MVGGLILISYMKKLGFSLASCAFAIIAKLFLSSSAENLTQVRTMKLVTKILKSIRISQFCNRSSSKAPRLQNHGNALIHERTLMEDIRKLRDQIRPSSTNDGDGSYDGYSSGALLTAYSNIRTCHCDTDDRCAMYKQSRKAFSI